MIVILAIKPRYIRIKKSTFIAMQSCKILWSELSENFSFALFTSNYHSSIWQKRTFCSKKSIKKLPKSKVESFLKLNFERNPTCETVLTQNH